MLEVNKVNDIDVQSGDGRMFMSMPGPTEGVDVADIGTRYFGSGDGCMLIAMPGPGEGVDVDDIGTGDFGSADLVRSFAFF